MYIYLIKVDHKAAARYSVGDSYVLVC